MPTELEKHLAGRITGRASDARRAVYEEVRAGLQSEVRAAAPFMPVQTVVARRRELENAIIAVEREAARSDPSRPPAPNRHETAVLAAMTAAKPETAAPGPEAEHEIETAPERGDENAPPHVPAGGEEAEITEDNNARAELTEETAHDFSAGESQPLTFESETDAEIGDYSESEEYAPPVSRQPIALYVGVLALVICAAALAAAIIGIGFDQARVLTAPPRATVRAAPVPPDPATELIKGAGFQGASRGAFKEGTTFLERRDYDRAIASLDDAIRLDPDAAPAYANRAFAYWNKGNVEAAIRDYGAAIERDPSNTANRLNRAVAFNRKGEYQAAVDDLDRVIAAEPANAVARNSRCWAHAVLAHLEEALADCNEALKLKPDDADTLDSRGFVYLRLGRLDRAIADYSAALKSQPKHAGSLYGRGLAKLGRGDRAGGNEDVQAAKAVDPDIVATFTRYGIR